jgi:nitrite reductase/ring-hydroxylating ferredoxin subunit
MGGTLVYRNQIGVDPRYADAGKWKEEYAEIVNGKIIIDKDEKLLTNQMKLVHAGGRRIVVARTENGIVAFDDRCTHRGGSLAGGSMMCGTVQCPWHGSQFDVTNGIVKAGPAKEPIEVYKVVDESGKTIILLQP